jgi:hypothetical protein
MAVAAVTRHSNNHTREGRTPCSLTLRQEHTLEVFENGILRRISERKRHEIIGGWGKLHEEELCNLFFSPNIIRMIKSRIIRWTSYVACMWKKRNANRLLMENPEGKRPLGRPKRRWKDCLIRSREMRWKGMDCIHLAEDKDQWRALMNTVP